MHTDAVPIGLKITLNCVIFGNWEAARMIGSLADSNILFFRKITFTKIKISTKGSMKCHSAQTFCNGGTSQTAIQRKNEPFHDKNAIEAIQDKFDLHPIK